jgi:hypothetical protein
MSDSTSKSKSTRQYSQKKMGEMTSEAPGEKDEDIRGKVLAELASAFTMVSGYERSGRVFKDNTLRGKLIAAIREDIRQNPPDPKRFIEVIEVETGLLNPDHKFQLQGKAESIYKVLLLLEAADQVADAEVT